MTFGQINPLSFIVAQRLAVKQNVDSSTATRHALVGTLLGEGILGPIIARQLAIRDAAAAPAPVRTTKGVPAGTSTSPLETISRNLQAWTEAESQRDAEDIRRANELMAEANERKRKRTLALKALCESLGALSAGTVCTPADEADEATVAA